MNQKILTTDVKHVEVELVNLHDHLPFHDEFSKSILASRCFMFEDNTTSDITVSGS